MKLIPQIYDLLNPPQRRTLRRATIFERQKIKDEKALMFFSTQINRRDRVVSIFRSGVRHLMKIAPGFNPGGIVESYYRGNQNADLKMQHRMPRNIPNLLLST